MVGENQALCLVSMRRRVVWLETLSVGAEWRESCP